MIGQSTLKKLKKEDAEIVNEHSGLVKAAALKKQDILSGKFEELGQHLKKPQAEVRQLSTLIKKIERRASVGLLATLLGIEVDFREMMNSVQDELALIGAFDKSKGAKMMQVTKKIEKEFLVARAVEHQINLLYSVQKLTHAAMKMVKESEDRKYAKDILQKCANIGNIAHFMGRVIFDEQVPNLAIIYNTLELEEWDEVEKVIMGLKLKFFEYRPNLL